MTRVLYEIRHVTRFDYAQPVALRALQPAAQADPLVGPDGRGLCADRSSPAGRAFPARAEAGLANVVRLVVEQPSAHADDREPRARRVDRPIPVPVARRSRRWPRSPTGARASRDCLAGGPAAYLFPSPLIPLDREIAAWCAEDLDPGRGVLEAAIALAQRIQREFAFDPTATLVDTAAARGVPQARRRLPGFRADHDLGPARRRAARRLCLGLYPHPAAAGPAAAGRRRRDPCLGAVCGAGPQLGWVGVDPTNGIWMAGDHIVIAIGRDYADIAPIDGIVLGSGAQKMEVSVDVEPLEPVPA